MREGPLARLGRSSVLGLALLGLLWAPPSARLLAQSAPASLVADRIDYDAETGIASIDVTIEAASIDMGADDWDEHMRGPDFFDVAAYPTVIFRANDVVLGISGASRVAGRLALLGVVRPVELEVSAIHCGLEVSTKRHKCGADITTTIQRSEWGLKKYVPFVADEVRLTIPVEAYRAER